MNYRELTLTTLILFAGGVSCKSQEPPRYAVTPTISPTPTETLLPTKLETPTLPPTATVIPTTTEIPTRIPKTTLESTPTPAPDKVKETIKKSVEPLWKYAQKKRDERAKNDPEYPKRVDKDLNSNRLNILMMGYGKSVEPPNPNLIEIGSQTIISINVSTGEIDVLSWTHDIWDPTINEYLGNFGKPNSALKIDRAFFEGKNRGGNEEGFRLMQKSVERMSGLAVDFQMVFEDDQVFSDLIDGVLGGLKITVKSSFDTLGYYYQGVKKGEGRFAAGPQVMNGERVSQYIKTVPKVAGNYDKTLEHNQRKVEVLKAIFQQVFEQLPDGKFKIKAIGFVASNLFKEKIVHDLPYDLAFNLATNLPTTDLTTGLGNLEFRKKVYFVDPALGDDGGVQWVLANAAHNANIKKLVDSGFFPSRQDEWGNLAIDMEVPINANPFGDFKDYWTTREDVQKVLK